MGKREVTTVFVTGVNGHVGNHIVRDLLSHGYRVKGSIRDLNDPTKTELVRTHAAELGATDRLELVEADVLDADPWEALLKGCDGLFHTATVYATKGEAATILETATKGTKHLLSAAHRASISRVIYSPVPLPWAPSLGDAPKRRMTGSVTQAFRTRRPKQIQNTTLGLLLKN